MLLLVCGLRFLKAKRLYLLFLLIASFFYAFITYVEIANWVIFNTEITASTIHIVLETTSSESAEFLSSYLNFELVLLACIYLIAILVGVIYSNRQFENIKSLSPRFGVRLRLAGIFFALVYIFFLRISFLPYIASTAIIDHQESRALLKNMSINREGRFKNVYHRETAAKETYVIIVGESTTSHHMSLYGYYRDTNPLLSKKRNELTIYKEVTTPNSNTIWALGKALTLDGSSKDLAKKYNTSLIQLFNRAGFHTYWISNQKPVGLYETSTRLISKTSYKSIYTDVSEVMYDEKILPPLQEVLRENTAKKLVVIHLMGTHMMYVKRYPDEFNVFKDTPRTIFNHALAYQRINEYDNAVLYNDYIVSQIINEVEKTKSSSFVLYFSDHGEDVYETIDQACHTQEIGTKPMHDIPFILWKSKKYISNNTNRVWDINRKYTIEHLIHTITDLSNITFDQFTPEKSIVNPHFKEVKRIIKNGKYYEDLFKKE